MMSQESCYEANQGDRQDLKVSLLPLLLSLSERLVIQPASLLVGLTIVTIHVSGQNLLVKFMKTRLRLSCCVCVALLACAFDCRVQGQSSPLDSDPSLKM